MTASILQELRSSFVAESLIERLTSSAPPITGSVVERKGAHHNYYEIDYEMEPADRNGRNLSAAMVTLIGSITAELNFYPPSRPIRRVLADYERLCRRKHRGRDWWDHATPICSEMLRGIVEFDYSEYAVIREAGLAGTWSHYLRGQRLIAAGAEHCHKWLYHWEHERLGIGLDPSCRLCRERRSPLREAA